MTKKKKKTSEQESLAWAKEAFAKIKEIDSEIFEISSKEKKLKILNNHPDLGECHDMWQKDKKSIMEWVNRQPTHYEYLKKYIYN